MPQFRVYFETSDYEGINQKYSQEVIARTPTSARAIVVKEYHPMPVIVSKIKNLTKKKK